MKMPEIIEYTAYLNFIGEPSSYSDQLMAKIAASAKIDKAALAVGLKSGMAQLDFSIVEDEEWEELERICREMGSVKIIDIIETADIEGEDIKVDVK